jgi:hypothetical protein
MTTFETWKPHPEYTRYLVSNLGRVRGPRGKILKPFYHHRGDYAMVKLSDLQRGDTTKMIHVIVLETYDKPRPEGEVARHLDGNPKNNELSNLAWGLPHENTRDAVLHGTHVNTKLNPTTVRILLHLRNMRTLPQNEVARTFGLSCAIVCQVWGRKRWNFVPVPRNIWS